jgi:hypothetical protein
MQRLYIGSGKRVLFTGMADAETGDYLNAGWSATWTLYAAAIAGADYAPTAPVGGATGSLAYMASGDYEGLIPDAVTAGLTHAARYFVQGVFTNGVTTDTRWIECEARRREC